jgi:hypothetical protein
MDLDPHGPAYDLTPETSAHQKHCDKITIYILLNTLFLIPVLLFIHHVFTRTV